MAALYVRTERARRGAQGGVAWVPGVPLPFAPGGGVGRGRRESAQGRRAWGRPPGEAAPPGFLERPRAAATCWPLLSPSIGPAKATPS